jgi:flagellum-specific peptidoglycan hydrolase FlgJ
MESPRNFIDPIKYLNGTVATVKLPRGTGVVDATQTPPTIVSGSGTNMFASDKYTVFGDLLWDKTTGKMRQLTDKERSHFYPNGMNRNVRDKNNAMAQAQSMGLQTQNPTMGLQSFGGASDITSFGKVLQGRGWNVGEHPDFGRVGKHAPRSYHYRNQAIDVTPGKQSQTMQQLADEVVASGDAMGVAEVIHKGRMWKPETGWRKYTGSNQHNGHVHIAFRSPKFKANFVQQAAPNAMAPQNKIYGRPNMTINFNGMSNKQMFDTVVQAAAAAGDPHPLVTAAQWALESGWGKYKSGKNNFFGIKSGKAGVGSLVPTWEVINGKKVNIKDWFMDYDTIEEGIAARVKFAQGKRYSQTYNAARTPIEAARALHKAGYATDPQYANKLGGIMRSLGYDPNTPFYTNLSSNSPSARDFVSNRPARVAKASGNASTYPANKPGLNYGYPALVKNKYLNGLVLRTANELRVPAQWVADYAAAHSKGKFDSFPNGKLSKMGGAKTIDEFAARGGVSVEELGVYANRQYSATTFYRKATPTPFRNTPPNAVYGPPAPRSLPPTTPRVSPIPTIGLPERVQEAGGNILNQLQNSWQRMVNPRFHSSPRGNCPTCQQMQRSGNFRPHSN